MKKISAKQQKILDFITDFTAQQGYPPSVREIGDAMGLKSPSTVHAHLKRLQDLGCIAKNDRKTRAITVTGGGVMQTGRVPILGTVTAGQPILAVEDIEGYVPFDTESHYGEHFALRIRGDSMIEAGILDGDLIIVRKQSTARNGQIVVALIEDEATCKTFHMEDGHLWLLPENPAYEPIDGQFATLLGVVAAVYRNYSV